MVKTVEILQNLIGQSQRRIELTRLPVHSFRVYGGQSGVRPQYWRRLRSFQVAALTTPSAHLSTLYKRKGEKVLPKNVRKTDGSMPGGEKFWKNKILAEEAIRMKDRPPAKLDKYLIPRFADEPIGVRLTAERRGDILLGDDLTPQERILILQMFENREMALAWTWEHIGRVRPEVTPPLSIETVPHEPWQAPNFTMPHSLRETVIEMIRDRLRKGVLEECNGAYRNSWFLVKKKESGKYRLINSCTRLNAVTIKDGNLPPTGDSFSEDFAGMQCGSYIDLFSGYDQLPLDERSRDYTAIHTPLGLFRQTTLPQGATNSVAQFVRTITKVLAEHLKYAKPYMDDIGVQGPRSRYGDKEEEGLPGVRSFMLEHIQNLDRVLADLERAGLTISMEKSQFCMRGLQIVGYVCDVQGRHPVSSKTAKIDSWPDCCNLKECRSFMGLCGYYRIWVIGYAIIAAPIYNLFIKGTPFLWGKAQRNAMAQLKMAITSAPALMPIRYDEPLLAIFVMVDASLEGWGGVLEQEDAEGQRHPARFESGVWSEAERNYDACKRECKGVVHLLKKFRHYLYGVHFVLETDAKTLVAQLNRSASDLPTSLVTRWLAWLHLFDFEVRHVPGKKNVVADALSRRPRTEEDEDEEEEVEKFLDAQLACVRLPPLVCSPRKRKGSVGPASARLFTVKARFAPIQGDTEVIPEYNWLEQEPQQDDDEDGLQDVDAFNVVNSVEIPQYGEETDWLVPDGGYSDDSKAIARFLKGPTALARPHDMTVKEFRKFKDNALKFACGGGHLFRKSSKNMPMRRVIDDDEMRKEILEAMHEQGGHKGRERTYRRVADRYWWPNMGADVEKHCRTCDICQRRRPRQEQEALHPTWVSVMWKKVSLDVVHMPAVKGKRYIVVARDDLSGWVEARALSRADSKAIAKFIKEEIFCRHGQFYMIVVDGGTENQGLVDNLRLLYGFNKVTTSAYHPQANPVERGHQQIKAVLAKLGWPHWVDNLSFALWADRISIKSTTGVSPFRFNYGYEPLLPIEERIDSWQSLAWSEVRSREDLIAMRILQLQRRDEEIEEIGLRVRRMREQNKEYFDDTRAVRDESTINVGDLVLLHNTKRSEDMRTTTKMSFVWLGPYRVLTTNHLKGYFTLEDLDGTEMRGTVSGARLKLYHIRQGQSPAISYGEQDFRLFKRQEEAEEDMDAEGDDQEEEEEETLGLGEGAAADNVVYEVRRRLRPRRGVVHTDEHLSRLEDEGEIVRAVETAPGSQQKQYDGPWVVIPRREKQ
jgi:hypothetical protein